MLNWMGTQKSPASTDSPQVPSLLRDTHDVIAGLPLDNAVLAVAQITEALDAISGADTLTLEERYDDIYLLDTATVDRTRVLLRDYLRSARQKKQREAEIWNGAYQCWRSLAAAYTLCVQRYAADNDAAAGFQKPARVAVARAMRALRRQLQWQRIRYAAPVPAIWIGLANLYTYIKSENIEEEMLIYPSETTTIKREFLKALVQSALSCEKMQPPGQDLATFIVSHYAPAFVLSKTPDAGCTHWFDLKRPRPPERMSNVAPRGTDAIYFGAGTALSALEKSLRIIEHTGQVPEELGFQYPIELSFLTPVLTQIYQDWAGQTPVRQHERQKTTARIIVVPGFKEIIEVLDHARADPFDFTARTKVESWVANDISAHGFGAVIPAVTGDWVSVASVAGIESEVAGEWAVGIVRRVHRLDDGQQQVGIHVISRNAVAIRMMREDPSVSNARITQRMPFDRAILLTADAVHQKEIEILVTDVALYGMGNVFMLVGDYVLKLQFEEVMEKTATCSRIRFTVLGVES
jgi:hypothetical protein